MIINKKIYLFIYTIVNISCFLCSENSSIFELNNDELIKINILLLLPINNTYKFDISKVLPALNLAVDEIKKTSYGSIFNITIITDECDCTGITAPINAMENIYGKRNHTLFFQAVFGPMCD
jgi:hypothetical protein